MLGDLWFPTLPLDVDKLVTIEDGGGIIFGWLESLVSIDLAMAVGGVGKVMDLRGTFIIACNWVEDDKESSAMPPPAPAARFSTDLETLDLFLWPHCNNISPLLLPPLSGVVLELFKSWLVFGKELGIVVENVEKFGSWGVFKAGDLIFGTPLWASTKFGIVFVAASFSTFPIIPSPSLQVLQWDLLPLLKGRLSGLSPWYLWQ